MVYGLLWIGVQGLGIYVATYLVGALIAGEFLSCYILFISIVVLARWAVALDQAHGDKRHER